MQVARGCKNYIFKDADTFHFLCQTFEKIARQQGAQPSFCSLIDPEALYRRSLGAHTDIVGKEMFRLESQGWVLRPEGTANLLHALLAQNSCPGSHFPAKVYYSGPMFRHERPQQGRYRQFWQFGLEILSSQSHLTEDVDLISLGADMLKAVGVADRVTLQVNNIGTAADRLAYTQYLREYFASHPAQAALLSPESQLRLEHNPLRILDSKASMDEKVLADLRPIAEFVTGESRERFERTLECLAGLGYPFQRNPRLVRGLDYYNDLCFEFVTQGSPEKGQAVLAGGRYDGLAATIRPKTKNIFGSGFAVGVDRLLDHFEEEIAGAMRSQGTNRVGFVILEDASALVKALRFRREVFEWGQSAVELDTLTCDVKRAGRNLELLSQRGCRFALIVGSEETATETVLLRDLQKKVQRRVGWTELTSRPVGEWLGPAGFECVP